MTVIATTSITRTRNQFARLRSASGWPDNQNAIFRSKSIIRVILGTRWSDPLGAVHDVHEKVFPGRERHDSRPRVPRLPARQRVRGWRPVVEAARDRYASRGRIDEREPNALRR